MKKGVKKKGIRKEYLVGVSILFLLVISIFISQMNITGRAVSNSESGGGFGGPTSADISCMSTCMGCTSPGVGCTGNREQCMAQCNLEAELEPADKGEACMQDCIKVGCGEFDFSCQEINKAKCEQECEMQGDKPDESEMSAEQICITECVSAVDPTMRCGNSQTGETGGAVCQKCAADCVHLYAGPCLDDEKLKAKQKECETCEHCYGEPVMGDSGEGWECITDVECKDASSEFGDNPGTGPGIEQEGFVASIGTGIGNVIEGIGNFISNLFGGDE